MLADPVQLSPAVGEANSGRAEVGWLGSAPGDRWFVVEHNPDEMEGWRASLGVRASLTHPPDYPSSAPTQKVTYVLVSRTVR